MPWSAFERLNREREFNEEPLFANPRNAASGTLKTLSSREVARRGLDAYFYYLIGPDLPRRQPLRQHAGSPLMGDSKCRTS